MTLSCAYPYQTFSHLLPRPVYTRCVNYEPGLIQKTWIETDVERTEAAYRTYFEERDLRLLQERTFLVEQKIDAVLADIPALAIGAAADCNLPAVAPMEFFFGIGSLCGPSARRRAVQQ